jgi:tetrahydromethanopterin S-methyltransferase subunit B
MTLLTWEEEEILHKVRELDRKVDRLELLLEEVLNELKPSYKPTTAIVVIPAQFDSLGAKLTRAMLK